VARYGGEEFSAILINAGREKAFEIAERVRRNVADTRIPNEGAQPNKNLTVSIGIATFSSSISTLTDLIVRQIMPSIGRRKLAGIASRVDMKTVIVSAALTIEQGKLLVTQRKKDSSHGLLWNSQRESGGGEDPRGALRRELKEELDVEWKSEGFSTQSSIPIRNFLSFFWPIVVGLKKALSTH